MKINKDSITAVCIDDFAIKKKHKYGSILIDIDTHKVIDIIESRDTEEVSEWLKTYPNIKIVSRDGSISYKNAIELAHPQAIQISDRFHLLKNLTNYCKEYMTSVLKPNIKIEKSNNDGISKSSICKEMGMNNKTLNNILKLFMNEELQSYQNTKAELKHKEKVKEKQELIKEIRNMHKFCNNISKIAKHFNLDRRTITKYIKDDTAAINKNYGSTQRSILDSYHIHINKLIECGATYKKIYNEIVKQGYTGSTSTIRKYMAKYKKLLNVYGCVNEKNIELKLVKRSVIIRLLYKPMDKIKELNRKELDIIFNNYPKIKEIISLVNSFRNILKNKDLEQLATWIKQVQNLNIKELNSFINGISRDIYAVKNAIKYDYNNGLAEGQVNKLKVIKRIMYGRNNFKLLKTKVLFHSY